MDIGCGRSCIIYLVNNECERALSALEFEFGYISTYVDIMTTTRTIVSLLCYSHHERSDYRLKGQI
jgi:hypothetical protein